MLVALLWGCWAEVLTLLMAALSVRWRASLDADSFVRMMQ